MFSIAGDSSVALVDVQHCWGRRLVHWLMFSIVGDIIGMLVVVQYYGGYHWYVGYGSGLWGML